MRAVAPGNIFLHDVLEPLGLTQTAAAERLGVPVQTVNQIVRGKRAISPEMALRLERAFEVSAEFWVRLQCDWDLQQARERAGQAA